MLQKQFIFLCLELILSHLLNSELHHFLNLGSILLEAMAFVRGQELRIDLVPGERQWGGTLLPRFEIPEHLIVSLTIQPSSPTFQFLSMSEREMVEVLILPNTSLKTSSLAFIDHMLGVLSHHVSLLE